MADLKELMEFIKKWKTFWGAAKTAGCMIPGGYAFKSLAPAFYPEAYPIHIFLGLFSFLFFGAISVANLRKFLFGRLPNFCLFLLTIFFVVAFTGYMLLLAYCTIDVEKEFRIPIGFWKYQFSLTEEGRKIIASHPTIQPKEMLLSIGKVTSEGAEFFWKKWSISLAGSCTNLLFTITYCTWCLMWAFLIKIA